LKEDDVIKSVKPLSKRDYRAFAIIAIVGTLLMAQNGFAFAQQASQKDFTDCQQGDVAGCTRIANDSSQPLADRARAWHLVGNAQITANNLDQAISAFGEAIKLDPPNAAIDYASRAIVEFRKADRNAAIADYRKAAALDTGKIAAMVSASDELKEIAGAAARAPADVATAAPPPAETKSPGDLPSTAPPAPAPAPAKTPDPFGEQITLTAKTVIVTKGTANWDTAFETLLASLKTLSAAIEKEGGKPAGNSMIVYTSTDDTGFSYLAEIPVEEEPKNLPKTISLGKSPDGRALIFVHRGSYDNMDNTYEAITNHLDDKKLEAKDTFIEEYMTDPLKTQEDRLVINVYVPLK
jgi:effector-binding domain-containing protein